MVQICGGGGAALIASVAFSKGKTKGERRRKKIEKGKTETNGERTFGGRRGREGGREGGKVEVANGLRNSARARARRDILETNYHSGPRSSLGLGHGRHSSVRGRRRAVQQQRRSGRGHGINYPSLISTLGIFFAVCLSVRVVRSLLIRASRKSQVGICLEFCAADFWPTLACECESAEQKPKHCLTRDFLLALLLMARAGRRQASLTPRRAHRCLNAETETGSVEPADEVADIMTLGSD